MSSGKYYSLKPGGFGEEASMPRESSIWHGSRLLAANLVLFVSSLFFLLIRLYLGGIPELAHCKQDLFSGLFVESQTLDHYEFKRFDNSPGSVYRGPPSDEGDAAWDQIVKVDPFSIDENALKTLGAPLDATKFPESSGGGYMANLAVFHQLHCLKTVWEYTYLDYYKTRNDIFAQPEDRIHRHLDHCVDMLRQSMMCSPDTSVITFKWKGMQELPMPEYSLPRTCRNFDEILDWGHDHAEVWPGADGFDDPRDNQHDR